jgi:AI-2 transport protein TqsA
MTPPPPMPHLVESIFLRRMRIATYGMFLLWLAVNLLEKFRDVLQPLFIALFLGFLIHPIHRWLVKRGIPSMLAYGVILVLVALSVMAFSSMMYVNVKQVADNLPAYEERLEQRIVDLAAELPFKTPKLEKHFLRNIVTPDQLAAAAGAGLGRFGDFTTWATLTFVCILFLIAEKVSFPRRLVLAFGDLQGERILSVVESINLAIGEYIAVKTLVSALAGFLSYVVLALFDVEFPATWGIVIFVLNYIPYLGSLVAVSMPILLSFVQFDEAWKGVAITILLIGIQQSIGMFVEPRMTGQRLDVSPLLIVLALAFWWTVWGIIGAILAVPLLVIVKIILDNIAETRPIATLISNR